MTWNRVALAFLTAVTLIVAPALAHAAEYHHVHITASSPAKGVEWYSEYLECAPLADRDDAANCDGVEVVFVPQATTGGSQGTGINHIGFSFPDLTAKMAEFEAVGVRGSGVRLQRFEDGSMVRDIPGLFKIAFIFDPWGTRIELVEDQEYLGFHHIHLSATNPEETLAWYRDVMGGEPDSMRGMLDGLLFDDVWLLFSAHPEGATPATTQGRAIDHIGFMVDDLDASAADIRQRGIRFHQEPTVPANGRTSAKQAFLAGPDNVLVEVVEAGFAGVEVDLTPVVAIDQGPFDAPLTSWGEAGPAGRLDQQLVARHPPGAPGGRGLPGADGRGGGGPPRGRHARQHLGLRPGVARHDVGVRQRRRFHAGRHGYRSARRPHPAADARGRGAGGEGAGREPGVHARPVRRPGGSHAVRALHHARSAVHDDAVGLPTTACRSCRAPATLPSRRK